MLGFQGDNYAALLRSWITDKVSDILVMPPLNSLILITLSRLLPAWLLLRPALEGRSHPHFGPSRLRPWHEALTIPLELWA